MELRCYSEHHHFAVAAYVSIACLLLPRIGSTEDGTISQVNMTPALYILLVGDGDRKRVYVCFMGVPRIVVAISRYF